jgi:hypothetical protein
VSERRRGRKERALGQGNKIAATSSPFSSKFRCLSAPPPPPQPPPPPSPSLPPDSVVQQRYSAIHSIFLPKWAVSRTSNRNAYIYMGDSPGLEFASGRRDARLPVRRSRAPVPGKFPERYLELNLEPRPASRSFFLLFLAHGPRVSGARLSLVRSFAWSRRRATE